MTPPPSTKPENAGSSWYNPPKRFENATFENFDVSRNPKMGWAVEAVRAVAVGIKDLALLYGAPGLGKTHLAWAALREVRKNKGKATLWSVPEFLAFLRASFDDERSPPPDVLVQRYMEDGFLLILDDLGTHNATVWAEEQLYRILNGRYNNEAPTIITANVGLDKIDARIRDRFRSGVVFCEGVTQR